jgi:hypothetical protein
MARREVLRGGDFNSGTAVAPRQLGWTRGRRVGEERRCAILRGERGAEGRKGGDGGTRHFLKPSRHHGARGVRPRRGHAVEEQGAWSMAAGSVHGRGDHSPTATRVDGVADVRQGPRSG